MKRCPECRKDYVDDTLLYCLDDGAELVQGTLSAEPATAILSGERVSDEGVTKQLQADGTRSRSRSVTFSLPAVISGQKLPWIFVALLAFVSGLFAYVYFNGSAIGDAKAVMAAFEPPPELAFNDTQPDAAVISPDGQKIAFTATSADGKSMLYIRSLDSTEVKLLPGSDNALEPFWSPDSRSIAYGSNGKLKRSDLTGVSAQVLCDSARLTGGSWSKDGIIIFGPDYDTDLLQVSAKGGEPIPLNTARPVRSRHPYFLPDGRHFVFPQQRTGLWAGSLDSPELKQIVTDTRGPTVYAPPGWLIFFRDDVLMAQAFDAGRLEVAGEPIPLVTGLKSPPNARRFSVSDNGVFVSSGVWQPDYQLIWYDREGKQTGAIDAPIKVTVGQSPMLSPDGKRLVVRRIQGQAQFSSGGANSNIWVVDLEKGGTGLRLTDTFSQMPVWSPDGTRILHNAGNSIVVRSATGSGEPETLVPRTAFPTAWSHDGRFIFYTERGVKTRMDVWALPLFGDRKEYLLLNSAFDEQNPQLSPDGRWLAYTSDETGNPEVYVKSFSADGKLGPDKKLISTSGGRLPIWRRDGSELFFVASDSSMMATSVKTGGTEFQFDVPKPLFKTRTLSLEGAIFHEYDVSPDGQRFLIGTLIDDTKPPSPTLILNWPALLKK
jgi:eukaryotic-like serine/threonine-protein kinase